ncbi:TetR family transcriptional regulator [Saccharomonospora piscinae]|uniref:TetR/AcrR family transcriptional regulator n=1 Tax=Saccharomonospora piscinae TaxID=687388 RepID=UPI001106590E|nr:TetR family transcriptional regulator [Saccharomonospora piscinae]TLW94968.1 TetR family transcriptional regulator [Saccharomonospora piscinae]
MQIKREFADGLGLTPTEAARRAQIIDATIEVIAEFGYARTSFARIIARAGLSSTRMISYHFTDKTELITATLLALIDDHDRFVTERSPMDHDRAAMLRSVLTAEIDYLASEPKAARALTEIAGNARDSDGSPLFEVVVYDLRVGRLARQLTQGQREGVFGAFDAEIMARAIRATVEDIAQRLSGDPGLDLRHHAAEITALFARATSPG